MSSVLGLGMRMLLSLITGSGQLIPLKLQPLAGSIRSVSTLKSQRPGRLTLVVCSMFTTSLDRDPGRLKKCPISPPLKPDWRGWKGREERN